MRREYSLALITAVLWGTLSPMVKLVLNQDMPQSELLCLICLIAAAFLFAVNLKTGHLSALRHFTVKDWGILIFFAVLGTFLYNAFYNYGIDRLPVQEATIINYLWPIMIVIFSCVFLKERMTGRKLIAILISFFGIVVVVTKLDFAHLHFDSLSGVIACLAAAVCYGMFCVLNKLKSYDQYPAMMIYYAVSGIICAVWMCVRQEAVPVSGGLTMFGLLWLGIIGNGIGYLLYALALTGGNTAKVSNLAYITPFMSLLFSRVLLKESISIYAVIGLVLVIAGILIQLIEPGRKKT